MKRILLATSNPHKLEEIQAVIAADAPQLSPKLDIVTLRQAGLSELDEPVEDQDTFEANALIKARYYADHANLPCMADDSGLQVDALGGKPGVISARYSGTTGPRDVVDPANNRLLLQRLGDTPIEQRTARFVCHMVLVMPGTHDVLASVRGTLEGRILEVHACADPAEPQRGRGTQGFGYDPLFEVPSRGKTTAELSPHEKNAISHRGDATRNMLPTLWAFADTAAS